MSYLNFKSNYDKYPKTVIKGFSGEACKGWENVYSAISEKAVDKKVLVIECYPGVYEEEIRKNIVEKWDADTVISMEDLFYDGDKITELMQRNLTDSRSFGIMYFGTVLDLIDPKKLEEAKEKVANATGKCVIYGFGASLVTKGDVLVYAEISRWEAQLRYRKGKPNYKQKNYDEDILRKTKRGFFIEWRIADRQKISIFDDIDLYLDTNTENEPALVSGEGLREGLRQMTKQPFRLVPYFDAGVWGGQWMKEVCGLDPEQVNYAWAFDGVPEENSVYMMFGDTRIETPSMNMIMYLPKQLMGPKNYARFGADFPLRFNFLDTMQGQNLSLQVHPTTEYIYKHYGMNYTQDESYYILDAGEKGGVYLGLKEDADGEKMIDDLKRAQNGEIKFDADKYVNFFPAKKHDHFLIPAGTIHCSSADCMVLEVSSGRYCFTYKMWDWDRLGLDGLPRPINVEDGANVIDYDRRTEWVKENLIDQFEAVEDNEKYKEVKTGLHEYEFLNTYVITTKQSAEVKTGGEVMLLNTVEGRGAVLESVEGSFEPFEIHYAETCIIPAAAGDFIVRPLYEGEEIKVLRGNIRH